MALLKWPKTTIQTPNGAKSAVAPLIISASRTTDIPAFHADWFFRCLRRGYVEWTNPFNRQQQYVSFEQARVIVFWTKNPAPIMPYLAELDKLGIGYYFQYTLNDYEVEKLESGVPPLQQRINTFRELSQTIGREKVIWRFDPLILVNEMTVADLLAKIQKVGDELHEYTQQLIFSFADIDHYAKVIRNLAAKGFKAHNFGPAATIEIAQGLQALNQKWRLKLATCAETADISQFGIQHASCIDGELMARLFPHDQKLLTYLGVDFQTRLFEVADYTAGISTKRKDAGQRRECGCINSKDIGQYNTCLHFCTYCYANYSEAAVKRNLQRRLCEG